MSSVLPDDKKNLGRGGGFCFVASNSNPKEFIIQDSEVSENACMYYGGGGHLGTNATLYLRGSKSKINKNAAIIGGAGGLHVTGNATFYFESGQISENWASAYGGGIHSSYECVLSLNGGTISKNIVYGRGGGVHLNTGGSLDLRGTDIIENRAEISLGYEYCEVVFNRATGTYEWNTPIVSTGSAYEEKIKDTGYGGGITIDAGTCTMYTGNLSSNYAEIGGGGIALVMINTSASSSAQLKVGAFTLKDGSVASNTTTTNGAGIYLMKNKMKGSSDPDVTEEVKNGIPQIIINKGAVAGNIAQANGGGIYQEEGTKFTIDGNAVFEDNQAVFGSGGAVYIAQGQAVISGGILQENHAGQNGGAMYISGELSMQEGTLKNNSAQNGGAAFIEGGGNMTVNGTVTMIANSASQNGGAAYIRGGGNMSISQGEIRSNTANVNGGALCIEDGNVEITSGNIVDNLASNGFGGGLYVYNGTNSKKTATFSGGTFSHNRAMAGGGLCVDGLVSLQITNTHIQQNSAVNAGGIYLRNGSDLRFGSGLIHGNVATSATPIETAYQKSASEISGVGGGLFLDQGKDASNPTTVTFTNVNEMGLYENSASNGADDIFANGLNTKVHFPNVRDMKLTEFSVPTNELYWAEDYPAGDMRYTDGLNLMGAEFDAVANKNKRYDVALSGSEKVYIFDFLNPVHKALLDGEYYKGYTCLTLGYELIFIWLEKSGLKVGDNAIFEITNVKDTKGTDTAADDVLDPNGTYVQLIFICSKENEVIRQRIALPSGYWNIRETNWAWGYLSTEGEYGRTLHLYNGLDTEEKRTFTFVNTYKGDENLPEHSESVKLNNFQQ